MMCHSSIEIYKKAIPLRVPLGIGLEINAERECADVRDNTDRITQKTERTDDGIRIRAVEILGASIAVRIVHDMRGIVVGGVGIGLIDVIVTTQMYSAHVQAGNLQHGVLEGLQLKAEAGLRSVWRLVCFGESHDRGIQPACWICSRDQSRR